MANTPKTPPPPYFNIDPEKAAARLSEPIDTARFAKAAAFAAKGRDDLAKGSRSSHCAASKMGRHPIADHSRQGQQTQGHG